MKNAINPVRLSTEASNDATVSVVTLPDNARAAMVPLAAEAIQATFRQGADLLVILKNGGTISIENFFEIDGRVLVLRDPVEGDVFEVSLDQHGKMIGTQLSTLSDIADMFDANPAEVGALESAYVAGPDATFHGEYVSAAATQREASTENSTASISPLVVIGGLAAVGAIAAIASSGSDNNNSDPAPNTTSRNEDDANSGDDERDGRDGNQGNANSGDGERGDTQGSTDQGSESQSSSPGSSSQGSSSQSSDNAGTGPGGGDPSSPGVAADGYIAGALVFQDLNRNGIFDENEPFTRTNAFGQYRFDQPLTSDAPLVATGGTDISTDQEFTGTLTAPKGSEVITPLTSLVQSLVQARAADSDANNDIAVDDAAAGIAKALGLEDQNLLELDPVAAAQAGSATAYAASAQMAAIITLAAAAAERAAAAKGDDASIAGADASEDVAAAMAERLLAQSTEGGPDASPPFKMKRSSGTYWKSQALRSTKWMASLTTLSWLTKL